MLSVGTKFILGLDSEAEFEAPPIGLPSIESHFFASPISLSAYLGTRFASLTAQVLFQVQVLFRKGSVE